MKDCESCFKNYCKGDVKQCGTCKYHFCNYHFEINHGIAWGGHICKLT